jgi:iron-sulfur cluster repair protein YtfE (RIC family)
MLNCGGKHTLEFAARKHGFNLEKMLQELNAAITSAPAPFS